MITNCVISDTNTHKHTHIHNAFIQASSPLPLSLPIAMVIIGIDLKLYRISEGVTKWYLNNDRFKTEWGGALGQPFIHNHYHAVPYSLQLLIYCVVFIINSIIILTISLSGSDGYRWQPPRRRRQRPSDYTHSHDVAGQSRIDYQSTNQNEGQQRVFWPRVWLIQTYPSNITGKTLPSIVLINKSIYY